MKSLSLVLALCACASAVAVPGNLASRQFPSAGGGRLEKTAEKKPLSVTTVPSKMRKAQNDTIRKKFRYGPYKLPNPKESRVSFGEKGTAMIMERVSPLCVDCIILSGGMSLEYANGTVADATTGIYNHHLTITQTGKPSKNMICPGGFNFPQIGGAPLVGTAGDASSQLYTTEKGDFNSGFFAKKGEQQLLSYQLINYRPEAQEVYVIAEAEYIPELKAGFLDATLANLVPNCARLETFLDKKVQSFVSKDYTVPQDGYILNTQGHLHNGGDNVELFLNGKSICVSKAEYTASKNNGHGGMGMGGHKKSKRDEPVALGQVIESISKCTKPVAIKKGDKLKVSANFDLEKHPLRTTTSNTKVGVMGFAIIMFAFPPGVLP